MRSACWVMLHWLPRASSSPQSALMRHQHGLTAATRHLWGVCGGKIFQLIPPHADLGHHVTENWWGPKDGRQPGCALDVKACINSWRLGDGLNWRTRRGELLQIKDTLGWIWTHVKKVRLPFGPEVPFDGGGSWHLTPPLAGDAAQFEAFAGHGLCVRVHLCTGAITPVRCGKNNMETAFTLGHNKLYK